MTGATLALSVVVVAYDMERELPRTLRSLSPDYQRGVDPDGYEVIVVDNGSPRPLDAAMLAAFPGRLRTARVDPAPASPARAANVGLEMASGELVGLLIDGARIVSPGLLALALLAARLDEQPIIATLAWHLGSVPHMRAAETGYDQATEDQLLAEAGWEADGYRLFDVSTFAGSSRRGFFGPLGESNGLFMPRAMWNELGGLDQRFTSPGGGRANHDLFSRACAREGARLILLLGEGTFHQIHGGVSTSRRFPREHWEAEYEALRGHPYAEPVTEPLYVGSVPSSLLAHLSYSAQWAARANARTAVTPSASGSRPD